MVSTTKDLRSALTLNRKALLAALARISGVVAKRPVKPILAGVRLEALDGRLHLAATDLDFRLYTHVEASGGLPPCLVACDELIRRLKAGKTEACTLALNAEGDRLVLNGGHIDHSLPTLALEEFPPVRPKRHGGSALGYRCRWTRRRPPRGLKVCWPAAGWCWYTMPRCGTSSMTGWTA